MQIAQTFFTQATGWHQPLPALDSPQTLVLVFGSYKQHEFKQPFLDLKKAYPQAIIIGCSGHGMIYENNLLKDGLSVCITRFKHTQLRLATSKLPVFEDSRQAGKHLAEALKAPDLKGIFVLTDGVHTNGTELTKGINSMLTPDVIVAGGMSADNLDFQATWLLEDGMPSNKIACGVGFYGENVRFISHAKDGWKAFGPQRLITKSHGNVLYELDHLPALSLYKQYLGDRAHDLPGAALHFPLSIKSTQDASHTVRTILGVNEIEQSLNFAGDVPEGFIAQLIYGSLDNLIEGAEDVAIQLANQLTNAQPPFLAVAVSCAARRLVLEDDTDLELEATLENFPPQTHQVGFYSFGELCPTLDKGVCQLHNQTMTLTVIHERG